MPLTAKTCRSQKQKTANEAYVPVDITLMVMRLSFWRFRL